MKIRFNRTGCERKALVTAIGEILGVEPEYKGAPKFIYSIDQFELDKEGTLIYNNPTEGGILGTLLAELELRGFTYETPEVATQGNTEGDNLLVIEVPKDGFTNSTIENLEKLIKNKGELIKKALSIDELTIEQTEETLKFPWFKHDLDADKIKAYTHFVAAICDMAKTQKRINEIINEVDNEKYAFRCFLLRLGFIGHEYKMERKILLSRLAGSSAFRSGVKKARKEDSNEKY